MTCCGKSTNGLQPDYFATPMQRFAVMKVLRPVLRVFIHDPVYEFKKSSVEWYSHYLLFMAVTCAAYALLSPVSNIAAHVVSMLIGSQLQGYYGCIHQEYLARNYKNIACFAGAVNVFLCGFVQGCIAIIAFTSFPELGLPFYIITSIAHVFACKHYMCRVEASCVALRQGEFLNAIKGEYEQRDID